MIFNKVPKKLKTGTEKKEKRKLLKNSTNKIKISKL